MTRCWQDLKQELKHIAYTKGITNTAHMIPADRSTVYRLISGETEKPSQAMKACVERLIEKQRSSQVPQSDNTADS